VGEWLICGYDYILLIITMTMMMVMMMPREEDEYKNFYYLHLLSTFSIYFEREDDMCLCRAGAALVVAV